MWSMYKFGKRQLRTTRHRNESGWSALAILLALAEWIRSCGPDRTHERERLREIHFPANVIGCNIVGHHGKVIATAPDSEMAAEISQRLNETEWCRQEDRWAL
jgi:hypothetical protein